MNFVLIGYRGTGKTSAGRKAADMLGMAFYDTDEIVKGRTGKTVREIVASGGWPAFRAEEKAAIGSLPESGGNIISLGGGAVLDPGNIDELRKRKGVFIWLFADPAVITKRIGQDANSAGQRPDLNGPGDDVTGMIRQRTPVYRGLADFMADTSDMGIDEVAGSICRFVKSFGER